MSVPQSILNIRRDNYTKDLHTFMLGYVPVAQQVEATLELARILNDHFNLTLDQYELDSAKAE